MCIKENLIPYRKTPLGKPFTICTTDGYVVDMLGPYYANENDATILKNVLSDKTTGLSDLLMEDDIVV